MHKTETPNEYLERLYNILLLLKEIKNYELSNFNGKHIDELKRNYLLIIDILNGYSVNIILDIKKVKEKIKYNEEKKLTEIEMINFLKSLNIKTDTYTKLKYYIYHYTNLVYVQKPNLQNITPNLAKNSDLNIAFSSIKDKDKHIPLFIEIKTKQINKFNIKTEGENKLKNIIMNKDKENEIHNSKIIINEQFHDINKFIQNLATTILKLNPLQYNIIAEIFSIENNIFNITKQIFTNITNYNINIEYLLTQIFNIFQLYYTYIINNKTYNIIEDNGMIKFFLISNMNTELIWSITINPTIHKEELKQIKSINYQKR